MENSLPVWKEGRLLLQQYVEEVGYTDTMLDMLSKHVRSLLGRSLETNGAVELSEGGPRATLDPGGIRLGGTAGETVRGADLEECGRQRWQRALGWLGARADSLPAELRE